ncbi:transcriptional regulator [Streptomyces sp. NPDC006879]|uniref:transcriptional regulator n=1 Tax=Streptomyces sp. NPDC006879 TaxID=3364767 RepID=UPI00369FD66C
MLVRLAAERATGVLLRDRGALYLAQGQVVHAESPAAPGLDVLLTAGGRLRPEGWRRAVDEAGARCRVGRFLVDSGQVPGGELELCHLGAIFDAAYFALSPSGAPARFRYGVAHWMGPVRPVPVQLVERETVRRRELLDRLWPHPAIDTVPVLRTEGVGEGTVTHRQSAVLALADGTRTPCELARELGRPAFHTLVDVRRLAAAGYVASPRGASPPAGPAVTAAPAVAGMPWGAHGTSAPDIALLRRLRDALEATL